MKLRIEDWGLKIVALWYRVVKRGPLPSSVVVDELSLNIACGEERALAFFCGRRWIVFECWICRTSNVLFETIVDLKKWLVSVWGTSNVQNFSLDLKILNFEYKTEYQIRSDWAGYWTVLKRRSELMILDISSFVLFCLSSSGMCRLMYKILLVVV